MCTCSVIQSCHSLQPYRLQPTGLCCSWASPGKNSGWGGSPFPLPGTLSDPGIRLMSSALAGRFFTTEPPGNPHIMPINMAEFCLWFALVTSVAQSSLTLCNPMNHSTPGLSVHHKVPESTQTHVHWVIDAIEPSHPLLSPSPSALNLFQDQGLFKWVSCSHQVVKVL